MNLRISYNWLKEHLATKKTARQLAKELSLCGPSVDFIEETKPDFEQVVVGQIKQIDQHPNADKLHVCLVETGEKQPLQIVCGAPNIATGQKVPVVLVGGRVGETKITPVKLRGVESFGMMCSQKELGLGEDHSGIFILPDYVEVGLPLAKVMPIADSIMDIEVTANRPDAMSVIGLAREAAAITGDKFLYQTARPNLKIAKELKLSVKVKESQLCPRYQAVALSGVRVEPSPLWLQQRLLASGIRPINNLVDITNYIMLEFGQPMHVFDYQKLAGKEINVRLAKAGEKILALDGKNYELGHDDLIIADETAPVAVAGIMGGELSAVSQKTTEIVFEAANFTPVSVRTTARKLNLHSESSSLFEKNLPVQGTEPALLRAVELAQELAGGQVASRIFDLNTAATKAKEIKLSLASLRRTLGVEVKAQKANDILTGLGFEVAVSGEELKVKCPWWREKDIEGEHDLIEEVARIYGYHNLPAQLMAGALPVERALNGFAQEDKIKDFLVAAGLTENYNYSFIAEKMLTNCGFNPADQVKVANPLSADFEYMRPSLIPSLLLAVAENQGEFKAIKFFELSRVYLNRDQELPQEPTRLAAIWSGNSAEEIFYGLKGVLLALADHWHLPELELVAGKLAEDFWQSGRAFNVKSAGKLIGTFGLIDREVLHLSGVKQLVAAWELAGEELLALAKGNPVYQPLPKFPAIELDLSMEIDQKILYQAIKDKIEKINPLIVGVEFLSWYHGDKLPADKKALAVRIIYRDAAKTLTLDAAQKIHGQVVAALEKSYNIKVR